MFYPIREKYVDDCLIYKGKNTFLQMHIERITVSIFGKSPSAYSRERSLSLKRSPRIGRLGFLVVPQSPTPSSRHPRGAFEFPTRAETESGVR